LQVSYFVEGNVKTKELYNDSPIIVTINQLDSSAYGQHIMLRVLANNRIELEEEGGEKVAHLFGTQIKRPYGTFTVTAKQQVDEGKVIRIQFNDMRKLANRYNRTLEISPVNKDASV